MRITVKDFLSSYVFQGDRKGKGMDDGKGSFTKEEIIRIVSVMLFSAESMTRVNDAEFAAKNLSILVRSLNSDRATFSEAYRQLKYVIKDCVFSEHDAKQLQALESHAFASHLYVDKALTELGKFRGVLGDLMSLQGVGDLIQEEDE